MSRFNVHAFLLKTINEGLDDRVARGIDAQRLNQKELSMLSGVRQPNLSAMMHGKPASESTLAEALGRGLAGPDLH